MNDRSNDLIVHISESGIATVTLNRVGVHNAVDDHLITRLIETFEGLKQNDSLRALVLSANGKTFSAGADLNWMRSMAKKNREENLEDSLQLAKLMDALTHFPTPTVAMIQGNAFGGAIGLIACCDIALAQSHAKFCLSEVKIGLIPAVISPYVIRAIGQRQASRYFLTAEAFDAQTAQDIGLIHHIAESAEAAQAQLDVFIKSFMRNGPKAMQHAKTLIQSVVAHHGTESSLMQFTSQRIADIRTSPEGQEGLSSFLEKRSPAWLIQSEKGEK